jgi:Tfp pilus assembly protein FimT
MRLPAPVKLALAAAAVVAALAMSAVIAGAAVQRRAIEAPQFAAQLGPARLAAFTTTTPNCRNPAGSGLNNSFCSAWSINSQDEYFTIWLTVRSRRGAAAYEQAHRLFVMRIGERPPGGR